MIFLGDRINNHLVTVTFDDTSHGKWRFEVYSDFFIKIRMKPEALSLVEDSMAVVVETILRHAELYVEKE